MPSLQKGKGRMECCEDIQELVSEVLDIRSFLTLEEESKIHHQFRSCSWIPDYQVLWSGMLREQAQAWADERGMQTLTTAMGPLMDSRVPLCPQSRKSSKAWSKYVHGASAVFAWHIAAEDVVTVLCPPPPQRFHPSGCSYYQLIEEPILKSAIADGASLRIELVHPLVKRAEDTWYGLWPVDEVDTWIESFGATSCRKCAWRMFKGDSPRNEPKKASKAQPVPAKATAKAAGKIGITTPARAECQPASVKVSKKKKKKNKSQKTQSKSIPPNAPSPVSQKKKGPTAKTIAPLAKPLPLVKPTKKARKKAKKKAHEAAMKQKEESKQAQVQRAAPSKKTQNTKVTTPLKAASKQDKGVSKPRAKTANSEDSGKGEAGSTCGSKQAQQLTSPTCAVQSVVSERRSGNARQEDLQEDVVYETWLDY